MGPVTAVEAASLRVAPVPVGRVQAARVPAAVAARGGVDQGVVALAGQTSVGRMAGAAKGAARAVAAVVRAVEGPADRAMLDRAVATSSRQSGVMISTSR